MDVSRIRTDLIAEQQALDEIVSGLDSEQWSSATPSPRWSVADQIGHLAYFDHSAVVAITDPQRFSSLLGELFSVAGGGDEAIDELTLGGYRQMPSSDLLEAWRANRESLAAASAGLTNDQRVNWYGPSMSSRSFLTARLMETWAHGQDIVDTVGVGRPATDRLQHIAQLGFITRAWSYTNRGLQVPSEPVRVELLSPSGEPWFYGPEGAAESVEGSAEDFCLVVTQRRHVDDTTLTVTELGRDWLEKAQAFAGPSTDGPKARFP
ncbi:MAG: TIGR03084 family protein [Acidimicrobiia bacterium]|nr:TIGR03084 family protein [Acidimicrobiia bacterium]